MKYKHFIYFTFLTKSMENHSKNLSYLAAGVLVLFREQIGNLLQKNYEIKINEV